MSEISLANAQIQNLNRLHRITRNLNVEPWHIASVPEKGWQFVLKSRAPYRFRTLQAIHRRLKDANVKTDLSSDGLSLIFDPAQAPAITRAQECHARERLSLEFGGKVAESRISRLEYMFRGLGLNQKFGISLIYDPASQSVFARIPVNHPTVGFDEIQQALGEAGLKVKENFHIRQNYLNMAEPDVLALTPLDAERGKSKLAKLLPANRGAPQAGASLGYGGIYG